MRFCSKSAGLELSQGILIAAQQIIKGAEGDADSRFRIRIIPGPPGEVPEMAAPAGLAVMNPVWVTGDVLACDLLRVVI